MKIYIETKDEESCEMVLSSIGSVTRISSPPAAVTPEPTLYPGLAKLENPTSKEVVEHVLDNPPKVQWYLKKNNVSICPVSKSKVE